MSNKRGRSFSPNENEDKGKSSKTLKETGEDVEMTDSPPADQPALLDNAPNESKSIHWLTTIGNEDQRKAEEQFRNSSKSQKDRARRNHILNKIDQRETSFKELPEIPFRKYNDITSDADLVGTDAWKRQREARALAIA